MSSYRKEVVKMARRVFFSFHHERDVWRANVVRHSWVTKPDRKLLDLLMLPNLRKYKDREI